jgi:hypothetical protein
LWSKLQALFHKIAIYIYIYIYIEISTSLLHLFENRVLRRVFGPKRDEVTGGCRKLHNNLYSSPNIIRMIVKEDEVGRACSTNGGTRNAYSILEGNRPLGRPGRRWVDNIKMDLREIGWDGMDWIDLTQDRDQWRALVEHGDELLGS